jgi:hypothetical protein
MNSIKVAMGMMSFVHVVAKLGLWACPSCLLPLVRHKEKLLSIYPSH